MSGSRDGAVPGWARVLGPSGLREFLAVVEAYFASRHIAVCVDESEGVVRPDQNAPETYGVFGLRNIAQQCSQSDRAAWPDLVSTHFNCVIAPQPGESVLHIDLSDFERIRPQLRARLYPVDLVEQAVESVYRPGPEGTLEVIVLDLPTTVRTVTRSEAKAWPLERETLFEIGRRNLAGSAVLQDMVVTVQPGVDLHVFTGDPFYAASHALVLERYVPALPHGALVAIPKRDVLMAHFIRNIGAAEAIGSMLQAVIGMHADGPGSLSPMLYWYRDGEFISLPYQIGEDALNFTPPGDFVAMLRQLAGSADLS